MHDPSLFPGNAKSLVELLIFRKQLHPKQTAYIFLDDQGQVIQQISYEELHQQALIVAANLTQNQCNKKKILLLMPPGIPFVVAFFGCLYCDCIVIPSYPPTSQRNINRLDSVIAGSDSQAIICNERLYQCLIKSELENKTAINRNHWHTFEAICQGDASNFQTANIEADQLCFIQFTSGSTRQPKGVMLTHGNLLYNLKCLEQVLNLKEPLHSMTSVSWLPPYHDLGLIGGILGTIYLGATSVMMSPMTFIKHPFIWLKAISDYQAIISGAPNFAYELCSSKITDQQKQQLNLSSWKIAVNGAEPIRATTLKKFIASFKSCGFNERAIYPCYGLAETTLMVAGNEPFSGYQSCLIDKQTLQLTHQIEFKEQMDENSLELISSGTAFPPHDIKIVEPDKFTLCKNNEIGEIWFTGPSMAQGYLNNREETLAVFNAHIKNQTTPYVRTGDLGFISKGQLYITGRHKDLIILQGTNHYPQDIEYTVFTSDEALLNDATAVFSIEQNNMEKLIIVQEIHRHTAQENFPSIMANIRQNVIDQHLVETTQILFIKPKSLPKTTSGKVQRRLCKKQFQLGELKLIFDSQNPNNAEKNIKSIETPHTDNVFLNRLSVIIQEITKDNLSISLTTETKLGELGLSSLQQIELIVKIEKEFSIHLGDDAMLSIENMADMEHYVNHQPFYQIDNTEKPSSLDQFLIPPAPWHFKLLETKNWLKLFFQYWAFQSVTGVLMEKPSRLLKSILAMKPFLNTTPQNRLKISKQHIWYEQFTFSFLQLPKSQLKIKKSPLIFPATWHQLNQLLEHAPKPSILLFFHMAGWRMILSMLAKASQSHTNVLLSFLGDSQQGHFDILKKQAEQCHGMNWEQLNHHRKIEFLDVNDEHLHIKLNQHIASKRLLVVLPDTILAQQGKGEPVPVNVLKHAFVVASGIFKLAQLKKIPLIPVVHGFDSYCFKLDIQSPKYFEYQKASIHIALQEILSPLISHLEQFPAQWNQWDGLPILPAESNVKTQSSTALFPTNTCVDIDCGDYSLVINLNTHKIIQLPNNSLKCLKKSSSKDELIAKMKKLGIDISNLDETLKILSG